jgi:hypothetical protein
MINFSTFLLEARSAETELKNVEDAKGKLFEILSGSYLLHGAHSKTGLPKKFLEHYRDEDGFRPQEVHDKIKTALQKLSPGMYEQVVQHAKSAADHLKGELQKRNIHNIDHLAWTSQKGDHERFTGVDDPNSDADLMVKGRDKNGNVIDPVGMSMKYGKQKDPNLRGNGLDALEKIAGLKKGDLEGLREAHYDHVRSLGLQTGKAGDAEYKRLAAQNHPKAKSVDEHALQTQQEMSRRFTQGLGKLSSDQLRNSIKNVIAPETKYLHIRHHTQVGSDGSPNHETHNVQDHANKVLGDYEEFRVRPHSGGISTVIEGRRKGSNDFERAMEIGMKKTRTYSARGFNSFTKAPMLREGRKTKAKKLSDMPAIATAKATKVKAKPVATPAPVQKPNIGEFGQHRGEGPNVGKQLPRHYQAYKDSNYMGFKDSGI